MSDQLKRYCEALGEDLDLYDKTELYRIYQNKASGAPWGEFDGVMRRIDRAGLDLFRNQAYIIRNESDKTGEVSVEFRSSIQALRMRANETGQYAGQRGPWWTGDGQDWTDVWLGDEPPAAAKVEVLRTDFEAPMTGIAKFDEYAATYRSGDLMRMWAEMPAHMNAKCAEALALKRAFPQSLGGILTRAEMHRDDRGANPRDGQAGQEASPESPSQQSPSQRGSDVSTLNDKLSDGPGDDQQSTDETGGPHGPDEPKDQQPYPNGASGERPGDEASVEDPPGRPRSEEAEEPPAEGDAPERDAPERDAARQGVSGAQSGAPGQKGDSSGEAEGAGNERTITTGEGSQLNYLFAVGVHEGPYTKEGLKQMVEREFGVESIDALLMDDFDRAKDLLGNEQMAVRYNKEASGKAGTQSMFDAEGEGQADQDNRPGQEQTGQQQPDQALQVQCPYCGAEAGEPCESSSGDPVAYYHKDREEKAGMATGTDTEANGITAEQKATIARAEQRLAEWDEQNKDLQELVAAISVEISEWDEPAWEECVQAMEPYYGEARQECDLRRTPEELREGSG